mgnify:CR=1 FL=1
MHFIITYDYMIKRIIIEQSKDGKKERRKKKLVNKLTQRGIVGT